MTMVTPRSSRRAKTLAAKYYNSAEIYELETERIFNRHWLCVGREMELSVAGDIRLLEINGESLILVRGNDQVIRCFYNVCRHRGTRLCEVPQARPRKSIRCSYHGWTYDLNGQLRAAPNMSDVDGFDPTACSLKELATDTWGGFVFVNSTHDQPFPIATGDVADRLQRWSLVDLVSVNRHTYEVRANWKLLFQNYNECYHCPCIHPSLNTLSAYTTATNDLEKGPLLGGPMQLSDGVHSMTTTGAACAAVLPHLSELERRSVFYYSLFPTILLSPHPDYVLVHRIERLTIDLTRVVCEFLFHSDSVRDPKFDPSPAVQFWDETNRQDWHVCELSQQGISSRAYEPGPYSNLESTVAAFDRYYLEALGKHASSSGFRAAGASVEQGEGKRR